MEAEINNKYDYSNILPTEQEIIHLVEYLSNIYMQFSRIEEEDERRNEGLESGDKHYKYKKSYKSEFEIYIKEKGYNSLTCNDLDSFQKLAKDNKLKNIASLDIKMDLSFKRGHGTTLEEYDNAFTISFKPYEITFVRTASHSLQEMQQIEDAIKNILDKFPVANSIFCTK